METKCCGTCRWHILEDPVDYSCANGNSEHWAEWTDHYDCCEEWEERT